MNDFLGLDLGTSSVKVLRTGEHGIVRKSRKAYASADPEGWVTAAAAALREIDTRGAAALGLSSQVGTYVVNDTDVYPWSCAAGAAELGDLVRQVSREEFIREIGMPHPRIQSYPLPRLMFFMKKYGVFRSVYQPKELLCRFLTGRCVGDYYSYRGLAAGEQPAYSTELLARFGIPSGVLPPLLSPWACAGTVTAAAASATGLPEGMPVYVGMNDFFCSLIGMGISLPGDAFDITGTSEHLGVAETALRPETKMVSSPFCGAYVHYGVTAASGKSLVFGTGTFGEPEDPDPALIRRSPIFLPYLGGERAPVFDPDARGTFFGIEEDCDRAAFAYSVREGVAFSIAHIAGELGLGSGGRLRISGGAAGDRLLGRMKASLLGREAEICAEPDTSALGAALIAACGSGTYASLPAAQYAMCRISGTIEPEPELAELLQGRFEIYKSLYPALKKPFEALKEIKK